MPSQFSTTRTDSDPSFSARVFRGLAALLGRLIWLTDEGPRWLRLRLQPSRARQPNRILGTQPPVEQKQSLVGDGVVLVRYQTLQFSFWRSIEHNMIRSLVKWLRSPVLDLGCGDGGFANACLERVDFGIDLELSALARAEQIGTYQMVALADASTAIPFASNWFGSVFSNSVVEHVPALPSLLNEVARILKPGGTFVFTVPGKLFVNYLAEFTGPRGAYCRNEGMGHINLLSASEWSDLLRQHGFDIGYIGYYLSPNGVRIWRILTSRVFRYLEIYAGDLIWRLIGSWLLSRVNESLYLTTEGAGIIIVAIEKEPTTPPLRCDGISQ